MALASIFFADGLEEIEGLTVVDLLRRAGITIQMVSITGNLLVTGSHGIQITTDVCFEDADFSETELFILPGGLPGTTNLGNFEPLCSLLIKANEEAKYISAICAAPSVLGKLNLLQGKKATCYPGFEDQLTDATYLTDSVVVDGNAITSRGMGTAIEFSAALISLFKGKEVATDLLKSIMYPFA